MEQAFNFKELLIVGLLASSSFFTPIASSSVSDAELTSRVVGGSRIAIDLVPSTVALLNNEILELTEFVPAAQFCGGTLINSQWIVTAAHCLLDAQGMEIEPDDVRVLMGSTSLANPVVEPAVVDAVFVHQDYFSAVFGNDIGLLRLSEQTAIPPTPIYTSPIVFNDRGYVAGWGALDSADDVEVQRLPLSLNGAAVTLVPGITCNQIFDEYNGVIRSTQLCAGLPAGGVDTCQGDSGGPLYYIHENNDLSLAGITSWGIGCGRAETPGVYTHVDSFRSWIDETIASETVTPIQQEQARPAAAPGTRSNGGGGAFGPMLFLSLLLLFFTRLRYVCRSNERKVA